MAGKRFNPEISAETPEGASLYTRNLAIRVDALLLSVRAQNVLKHAEIEFVGDLVQWTEKELRKMHNCGRKTVDEVQQQLAELGLHLGAGLGISNRPTVLEFSATATSRHPSNVTRRSVDLQTRAMLCLRVEELGLSQRARNVLRAAKIEFVGNLVEKTETELQGLSSCGRLTISEIKDKLKALGLALGLDASGWSPESAPAGQNERGSEGGAAIGELQRKLYKIRSSEFLEDELRCVLASVASDRDTDMAVKQLGWSGKGQRTLESVGQEYSLTRERVRQVVARKVDKYHKMHVDTPRLDEALSAVRARCPATEVELAIELRERGISRENFHPSGLASACELLQKEFGLRHFKVGPTRFYAIVGQVSRPLEFIRLCRRLTSSQGCVNFEAVCDELRIPEGERERYREFASASSVYQWLDRNRRWLFAARVKRNRLSNLIVKVLGVSPHVNLTELRKAVARSRRLAAVPPLGILAEFLKRFELATVSDNMVSAAADYRGAVVPGSAESILVSVLRAHGPLLGWDRYQALCISAGMNPITFGIYVSGSPVIARVKRGIYSLVGADVPPGAAEDLERDVAAARQPKDWGWSPRGTFWYALPVTPTVLAAGSVPVPSFVADIVEGAWNSQFDGMGLDGSIKCSNGFLWGLRRPLTNAGAEPGDVSVLEFDRSKRMVNVTLGGEELVDMWESGNIDLPAPDITDARLAPEKAFLTR